MDFNVLHKMKTNAIIALSAFSLLSSCGFVFGPGYSAHDQAYFKRVPHIVDTAEETSLVWNYGSMGFYFVPRYKIKDGALHFSLQGTTSSGHVPGEESRLPIRETSAREALRNGGAYWWNTDGSKTKLKVNP